MIDCEKYCIYTPYDLPELKTDIFNLTSIIYFLYELNNIVYIGQTVTGVNRIQRHINSKKFNRWYALEVPKEKLNQVERYYIDKYQPLYNKTNNNENTTNKKDIVTNKEVKNFFDISCIDNTVSECRMNKLLAQFKESTNNENNTFDIFLEIIKTKSNFERATYSTPEKDKSKIKSKKKTQKPKLKKGNKPPYGYTYSPDKKSIAVDDKEAAIVKRIFSLAQTGNSIQKIVDTLNGDRIFTRQGKAWTKATVHGMLRNIFYTGVFTHQQKEITGNHEAIISRVQFGKVKKQLERRHK